MGRGKTFSNLEERIARFFAEGGEDGPLAWGYKKPYVTRPDFEIPSALCELMLREARSRGAFGQEDLDRDAERIAKATLADCVGEANLGEVAKAGWGKESERALAELERWVKWAGLDRKAREGRGKDAAVFRVGAEKQLRGKAALLDLAVRISEDPDRTRRAIARGFLESECPWKAGLLALTGDWVAKTEPLERGAGEEGRDRGMAWEAWGANFCLRVGASKTAEVWPEGQAKEKGRDFARRGREAADSLMDSGLPGFFGSFGDGRSIFAGALAGIGGEPARSEALRMAFMDIKGLREALGEARTLGRLFGIAPDGEPAEAREALAFAEAAKAEGAWPERLPAFGVGEGVALRLRSVLGNERRAAGALALRGLYAEAGAEMGCWGEPEPEEMARITGPEGARLAMDMGGASRLSEALAAWGAAALEGKRLWPVGEGSLPRGLAEAGLESLLPEEERLEMWERLARAGKADAAAAMSFSPGKGASAERLLSLAEAIPMAGKGLLGGERDKADGKTALMMDRLTGSPAFRDALAASYGKRGMRQFSEFCKDYARIAKKRAGTGWPLSGELSGAEREARLESLRVAAKAAEPAIPAEPEAIRRRGL